MAKMIPAPTDFRVDDLVRVTDAARDYRRGHSYGYLVNYEGTVRAVYSDIKVCAVSFVGRIVHVPMSLLENREPGRHVAMSQVEVPEKTKPLVDRHGQWTFQSWITPETTAQDLNDRLAEEASLDQWQAAIKPKAAGNPKAEARASASSSLDGMLTDALHPASRPTRVRVTFRRWAEFSVHQDLDWHVLEFSKDDVTIEEF